MYKIRSCEADEIGKLQRFIDLHWKKEHILSVNAELLKWQHLNTDNNTLNFIVAVDRISENFIAILGFIPLSHFDKDLQNGDFWLAIWKVADDNAQAGVGLQLLNFLIERFNPTSIGSIGINNRVKKLYKLLKFSTNHTSQYYLLNSHKKDFAIAEVPFQAEESFYPECEFILKELHDLEKLQCLKTVYKPVKSIKFLINRYQKHPLYKYYFYTVSKEEVVCALLVIRKLVVNSSACLRVVDVFGDLSEVFSLAKELNRLMDNHGAEYIDCVNAGIKEENFIRIGFVKRREEAVIPNFFEPFEKRNVDIHYAVKSHYDNYVIWKGDSDQDRPNLLSTQSLP